MSTGDGALVGGDSDESRLLANYELSLDRQANGARGAGQRDHVTGLRVISTVYGDICRMLAYEPGASDYSLADVAELVGQDPGIAARVLKMINSAVFGLPQPVTSVLQAVALLGARRMATLMMRASLKDQLRVGGRAGQVVAADWEHARLVAHLAREIATYEGLSQDEAETP